MPSFPIVRQSTCYSCGAAAVCAEGLYWGVWDGREPDLFGALETTPENGTEPDRMARVLRSWGLKAHYRVGMTIGGLRRSLDRGARPILAIQAWPEQVTIDWSERWDDGHYVVLVGMSVRRATFMDPSTHTGYAWMPLEELKLRWHDVDTRGKQQGPTIVVEGKTPMRRYPARSIRLG